MYLVVIEAVEKKGVVLGDRPAVLKYPSLAAAKLELATINNGTGRDRAASLFSTKRIMMVGWRRHGGLSDPVLITKLCALTH